MPSKSRRAASRQTQMKRKRRGKPRTQEFDLGPAESRQSTAVDEAMEEAGVETAISVTEAAPSRPVARSARRSRRQVTSEAPLVYGHLGSELKRIGAITALIAVALVVLTFVLGG
ncbi:MAG: hypothetical protein IH956_05615 [Chloroflexi bacterium]|nr:hypothetical protein [Chloroflexota bacterium]